MIFSSLSTLVALYLLFAKVGLALSRCRSRVTVEFVRVTFSDTCHVVNGCATPPLRFCVESQTRVLDCLNVSRSNPTIYEGQQMLEVKKNFSFPQLSLPVQMTFAIHHDSSPTRILKRSNKMNVAGTVVFDISVDNYTLDAPKFASFTVTVKVQVLCDTGCFGPDCSITCDPRDDQHGHYSCDDVGNKICIPGFTDPLTHCQRPSITMDQCGSRKCKNGGYCITKGDIPVCMCGQGWTGDRCDVDIDECAGTGNLCQNGGMCINLRGGFMCLCTSLWTGSTCGDDIDECADQSPCQHGGRCENHALGFTCICKRGCSGKLCQKGRRRELILRLSTNLMRIVKKCGLTITVGPYGNTRVVLNCGEVDCFDTVWNNSGLLPKMMAWRSPPVIAVPELNNRKSVRVKGDNTQNSQRSRLPLATTSITKLHEPTRPKANNLMTLVHLHSDSSDD